MINKEQELAYLARADHHIAEAKKRLQSVRERIDVAHAQGLDTSRLEHLLDVLLEAYDVMQQYRNSIIRKLEEGD